MIFCPVCKKEIKDDEYEYHFIIPYGIYRFTHKGHSVVILIKDDHNREEAPR